MFSCLSLQEFTSATTVIKYSRNKQNYLELNLLRKSLRLVFNFPDICYLLFSLLLYFRKSWMAHQIILNGFWKVTNAYLPKFAPNIQIITQCMTNFILIILWVGRTSKNSDSFYCVVIQGRPFSVKNLGWIKLQKSSWILR